jgi:hypothetical protein
MCEQYASNLVRFCLFCVAYNTMYLKFNSCMLVVYIITSKIYFFQIFLKL